MNLTNGKIMKSDGVYFYNIIADNANPLQSMYSFDLLFLCENNKLKWLHMPDNVRFCIPITKDNGEPFDSVDDFLSNPPKGFDLTLDYKYKIIEHKSKYNVGEYYKNIYRPVISYKLQRFHLAKNGVPFIDSYDDISIWRYKNEYLSHLRQLELILDETKTVFRVIEPAVDHMNVYGHMLRDIIISSCAEIDSMMKKILKENDYLVKEDKYTTNHYYKLREALRLDEYEIGFTAFENIGNFSPFSGWKPDCPTQSIFWYDAYNKVKHDRESNFSSASLKNALTSIAAYAVLLLAQYGTDNSIWNEHTHRFFYIKRRPKWDLEDFYVPPIEEEFQPVKYPFK